MPMSTIHLVSYRVSWFWLWVEVRTAFAADTFDKLSGTCTVTSDNQLLIYLQNDTCSCYCMTSHWQKQPDIVPLLVWCTKLAKYYQSPFSSVQPSFRTQKTIYCHYRQWQWNSSKKHYCIIWRHLNNSMQIGLSTFKSVSLLFLQFLCYS